MEYLPSQTPVELPLKLGQKLIASGAFNQVVLVPAAVGSFSVARWRENGDLYEMLKERLQDLKANRIEITHFLWHQGESDNPNVAPAALRPEDYKAGMLQIIHLTRKFFPKAKFYVSIASRCNYPAESFKPLQNVQIQLTKQPGVYQGPNTDEIGLDDRYDNCHFSATGLEKHAAAWVNALGVQLPK